MSTRTAVILLSAALVTVTSEPVTLATEVCAGAGERACPQEPQPPKHKPEYDVEPAVIARAVAEQAPPPRHYVLKAETGRYNYAVSDAPLILTRADGSVTAK
jgi:hypothetical protein